MSQIKRLVIKNCLGIEELAFNPGKVTKISGGSERGKTSTTTSTTPTTSTSTTLQSPSIEDIRSRINFNLQDDSEILRVLRNLMMLR